MQLPAQKYFYC